MGKEILMRDALLERVYQLMEVDPDIYILSDDMGAPILDKVRVEYPDRFVNVGIAEQNLVNVASGLALEGMKVFTYAISPFYMRAYEQIRVNLAITGQLRPQNVTMIGVGCGVSYDVSGPTHHCLEDLSIMRTLPNIEVFSPCDYVCAGKYVDYSLTKPMAKYCRLDGKKLGNVYSGEETFDFFTGFKALNLGQDVVIISTGYMTRIGLELVNRFREKGRELGLIDVFSLNPLDRVKLQKELSQYQLVITLEEAFKDKAGLDAVVSSIRREFDLEKQLKQKSFGFPDQYLFEFGPREHLYSFCHCDSDNIEQAITEFLG